MARLYETGPGIQARSYSFARFRFQEGLVIRRKNAFVGNRSRGRTI